MRTQSFRLLLLVAVLLAGGGCIDAVREGVTDGISKGLKDVVSNFLEPILGDALNGN